MISAPPLHPNDYDKPDGGLGFVPQWIAELGLEAAWDLTTGNPSVVVGLPEKGFDLDHSDFFLNVFVNEAELPREFVEAVGGRKRGDCDADGVVSMFDLNCLDCSVASTPMTPEETCRAEFAAMRVAACSRDSDECIPQVTLVTPSVLAAAMRNGDSTSDTNPFPDDVVGWDFTDGDNNPGTGASREGNHGMEMAGIIAGVSDNRQAVAGIMWKGRVIPLRATTRPESVEAIEYAVALGAQVVNYSRGETYFADAAPNLSYGGAPCLFTRDHAGVDYLAGKRAHLEEEWGLLDLSHTLLSVAAPNCPLDLDLDAGTVLLDWPSQWSHPSVITSAPSSSQNARGDIIAVRTQGGPGLVLYPGQQLPDGGNRLSDGGSVFLAASLAAESASYSAAYVSGIASLVVARFPNAVGPCLRQWMTQDSHLYAPTAVLGVDGGSPCP